jgi:outer membrane protein OmpA-like peptidoglycan-associated protein
MSDEKHPENEQISAEPALDEEIAAAAQKNGASSTLALVFVIVCLLGVLVFMLWRSNFQRSSASDADITALQSEIDARREELNRQRVSLGLSPLEGGFEPVENISARLKKDADSLVALAGRFQEMLSEKDSELTARNSEILRSEKLRQSLAAESSRLQQELQRALVGGSDADRLRRELADLKSQRDALVEELGLAREKISGMSAGVASEDYEDLKRRYEETLRAKEFFEARVQELESDLSKAKLFASSENELLPAAVSLFRALRALEGRPDSDLTSAYSGLGVELGANVLHTLNFATGSSELTADVQDLIRGLTDEIPDGDLLLVIGYASETGNVEKNQTLSSERATAVAQAYSAIKRPGQLVQAVYLGQTDRFSSRIPERNQLCEIWRIRKK